MMMQARANACVTRCFVGAQGGDAADAVSTCTSATSVTRRTADFSVLRQL